MKRNALSQKFTAWGLIRFALPTVIMMIFLSLYTMVDGMMVSRLISTDALSAVNIVYPLVSVIIAVAIMLATGASAVVARKLGEEKPREAREDFTMIVCVGVVVGILIMLVSLIFLEPMLQFMGANDDILPLCREYAGVLVLFTAPSVLQMLFQTFFVTAGRPMLGLFVTILGGVANIVLDYVFIVPLDMGIAGAAWATGIGYSIPAVTGLVFFSLGRGETLHFVRPKWRPRVLGASCFNGSSEMVTNLSTAVITYLFNIIMMRRAGPDGVAAITIVLYSQFFLTALYLGYSSGVAPVVSYNYGNGDTVQLKRVFRISLIFLIASSVATFGAAMALAKVVVGVFSPAGTPVFQLAVEGFYLFSFCYLFMGVNIFASSLFTALSNGRVSAILSFARTFAFILPGLLLLPRALDLWGVWLAVPLAEGVAVLLTLWYFVKQRDVYHYA